MKLKIYSIVAAALLMASCEKPTLEAEAPVFDVNTEKATYKVGEIIKFMIIGGESQNISFYSGELLKDYNSRTGRVVDVVGAGANLTFSSSVQLGTQADQLSLLASTKCAICDRARSTASFALAPKPWVRLPSFPYSSSKKCRISFPTSGSIGVVALQSK
jgi:hypothetical protein